MGPSKTCQRPPSCFVWVEGHLAVASPKTDSDRCSCHCCPGANIGAVPTWVFATTICTVFSLNNFQRPGSLELYWLWIVFEQGPAWLGSDACRRGVEADRLGRGPPGSGQPQDRLR